MLLQANPVRRPYSFVLATNNRWLFLRCIQCPLSSKRRTNTNDKRRSVQQHFRYCVTIRVDCASSTGSVDMIINPHLQVFSGNFTCRLGPCHGPEIHPPAWSRSFHSSDASAHPSFVESFPHLSSASTERANPTEGWHDENKTCPSVYPS